MSSDLYARMRARADLEDRADFAAGTVNWQTGDLWREAIARMLQLEASLGNLCDAAQLAQHKRIHAEIARARGVLRNALPSQADDVKGTT